MESSHAVYIQSVNLFCSFIMFLTPILLISFAVNSSATEIFREIAIAELNNYDVASLPEKVYLIRQTDMFLFKLELAEASPAANRLAIMEGWFEVIRRIVESESVSERSINILSALMRDFNFHKYRDLTSIMLQLYVRVIRGIGIDILEIMHEDAFPNKSLLHSIYQLFGTTGWVDLHEIPLIHIKAQEELEEILHNVKRLNSNYIALQRSNQDFAFKFDPIHNYLDSLKTEVPSDVSGLMLAMNLILPIRRFFFSRFHPEDLERQITELFNACYSKIGTDIGVIESIFGQLVETVGRSNDLGAARNRIRSAIDLVNQIDGELQAVELAELDLITVESGFNPVEGMRSFINRFFGSEEVALLSAAFESWAVTVNPAQIPNFFIYFWSALHEFSSYTLSELADLLADEFGINLYSFGYVNEDAPWRTEFVHHLIAKDPRMRLYWDSDRKNVQIASILSRFRRQSFKYNDNSLEVYFTILLNHLRNPVSNAVLESVVRPMETNILGQAARESLSCVLSEDSVHSVIQNLGAKIEFHPVFNLIHSYRSVSYQFRFSAPTFEPLFWLGTAAIKMRELLGKSLVGRDQTNSYQIAGDQLHRFLERMFQMTRVLTVHEQIRLLDAYIRLRAEPTDGAPLARNLDEIENIMRQIA